LDRKYSAENIKTRYFVKVLPLDDQHGFKMTKGDQEKPLNNITTGW